MSDETTKAIEPGVYFDMPEANYHADPALGSGDVRALRRSAPDYWYNSIHNPSRPPETESDARLRGRAIHKIVLEGEAAFDALYRRRKDDAADASPTDKGALTKAEKKAAAAEGRDLLHGDTYDRAVITGAMIRKNPHLASAFDPSGRSEVSVFWDEAVQVADGEVVKVRCKARFDKLRPRAIGDLKSITNQRQRDFVVECRGAIANYRYDIQAAHYLSGRESFPALVKAGKVFGARPGDDDFIAAVAKARDYAFVFVFFQAEGAPITWGTVLSPANPIVEVAQRHRNEALARYHDFRDRFGLSNMWLLSEPLAELDINDMPGWWAR